MTKEKLANIMKQVEKYNLINFFKNKEEFLIWATTLDDKSIENFLGLNIIPGKIKFPYELLINKNLLLETDYLKKINALIKIKNIQMCNNYFINICNPTFIKSDYFYKYTEIMSKTKNLKEILVIINDQTFLNSPFRDIDIKMIAAARDVDLGLEQDYVIANALASIAKNSDSIMSKYHRDDMELVSNSPSKVVMGETDNGLLNLALNKESLNDLYHLENMEILSRNLCANSFLFKLMTEKKYILGKNYRSEVKILSQAKSKNTAEAIYNFIEKYSHGSEENSQIKGNIYLKLLNSINLIQDKNIDQYIKLINNQKFIKSKYYKQDLLLLQKIDNTKILYDMYFLLENDVFLRSPFHLQDIIRISKTKNNQMRKLLIKKATDTISINSENYEFDIDFITRINFNLIDESKLNEIEFNLFDPSIIASMNHRRILNNLLLNTNNEKEWFYELKNEIDDTNITFDELITGKKTSKKRTFLKNKVLTLIKK